VPAVIPEQRQFPRKVFKTRALVASQGRKPVEGRTLDLSAEGVSVSLADPVEEGQAVYVRFDIFSDGKTSTITAEAKVKYCIFSQGEFKVGCQFVGLDRDAAKAVSLYLR
jgi:hypothetical protein